MSKVQELLQQLLQEDIAPQEICIAARKHSGLEDLQTLHEEVQYSTFHNLKGMEFKAMILTGLQQEDIPFIPRDFSDYSPEEQALHLRQEASVLYVAMSRAVRVLLLTGSGQRLEWWGEE